MTSFSDVFSGKVNDAECNASIFCNISIDSILATCFSEITDYTEHNASTFSNNSIVCLVSIVAIFRQSFLVAERVRRPLNQ